MEISQSILNMLKKSGSKCCNAQMGESLGFSFCTTCGIEYDPLYAGVLVKLPRKKADSPRVKKYIKLFTKLFPEEKIIGKKVIKIFDENFKALKELGLITIRCPHMKHILHVIIEISRNKNLFEQLPKVKGNFENAVKKITFILNYVEKTEPPEEFRNPFGSGVFEDRLSKEQILCHYNSQKKYNEKERLELEEKRLDLEEKEYIEDHGHGYCYFNGEGWANAVGLLKNELFLKNNCLKKIEILEDSEEDSEEEKENKEKKENEDTPLQFRTEITEYPYASEDGYSSEEYEDWYSSEEYEDSD